VTEDWRNYNNEKARDFHSSSSYYTGHQIKENRDGRGNLHVWERSECSGWWGNLEEINHLENLGIDGRIIS
jgi:hypothetical protein